MPQRRAQIVSLQIEARETQAEAHYRLELRRMLSKLLSSMANTDSFVEALVSDASDLLGFTPMQAIVAATRWGGELMRMDVGEIKPGKLADLLLVDGDPLRDLSILEDAKRLIAIMKGGVFHKDQAMGDRR